MDQLRLEQRGGLWVTVEGRGSCYPASAAEIELWRRLQIACERQKPVTMFLPIYSDGGDEKVLGLEVSHDRALRVIDEDIHERFTKKGVKTRLPYQRYRVDTKEVLV